MSTSLLRLNNVCNVGQVLARANGEAGEVCYQVLNLFALLYVVTTDTFFLPVGAPQYPILRHCTLPYGQQSSQLLVVKIVSAMVMMVRGCVLFNTYLSCFPYFDFPHYGRHNHSFTLYGASTAQKGIERETFGGYSKCGMSARGLG